jgi:DNA helicase-2/ATP-dependent DNA helicase PcrA
MPQYRRYRWVRFFTHGQNRLGDRHVYAARSRFIPDALLTLFQSTAWPMAGAAAATQVSTSQTPRIDVAAKMRGMWRQKDPTNV